MPRLTALLTALLGCALLAAHSVPVYAQKPTIQSSRGGAVRAPAAAPGGGSRSPSVARGGSFRSSPGPRSGSSRGEVAGPLRAAPPRTVAPPRPSSLPSTLSPGFPLKGRGEPSGGDVQAQAGRPGSRPDVLGRVSGTSDTGKRFIRTREDGTFERSGGRFRDGRSRRVSRGDGVTFFVLDPWFHDPFWRFSHFDTFRYRSGFGCGLYDRWFPGFPRAFYGRFGHHPCFSSFSLFLGWPGLYDPWPGFWSYGYYGSAAGGSPGDRDDYASGFGEGYERGLASGRTGAPGQTSADYEPGYDATLEGTDGTPAEGDPGYGAEDAGWPLSAHFSEGRRLMAGGSYDLAVESFEAYVESNPGDPAGHLARGVALLALGHYGKAAEAFRRGIDVADPGRRAYIDAPALFASRTEYRRVLGDLEVYVRTHADSRDARFALGALYLFGGERAAARSLLGGLGGDDRHATYLLDLASL